MIVDDRSGKKDYAYQIYQLITIELWFRNFVDNIQHEKTLANEYSRQSITEVLKN